MAEQLGEAVLRITIDDTAAQDSLRTLRRQVEQTTRSSTRTAQRGASAGAQGSQQSGLAAFLRELRIREGAEQRAIQIRNLGYKDALALERLLTKQTERRARAEQQAANRRGGATRGGGTDVGGIISSALIGGAFPLLFGQGGGAAGGGLIGGLIGGAFGGGGGFAGSLVGTLVGQTADKFGELAKALQDPVKNLDALIQGANLSGKGVEELAKVLVELGRTSEANALIQADLARTIDPVGVVKVAAANDAFARSVGDIQERIGYLLAGPSTQFISWIDQVIQRVLNLPASGPTQRGALATRGQGAALGVGGVLLGAAGLAAAPFTGGASLPLALGGLGLAAAGGTQIASAGFQESQIADSAAIEKIQDNITAIEERRVRLQRDITAAVRTGRKNAEAELRLQDQLLQIDAQKEQLKAAFQAGSGSAAELRSLKAGIAALNARKEAAVEAENQRQVALKATAQLDATQAALALQSVKDRLSVAEQLSTVEQGIVRSTLEQALNIQNGIAEARRGEQDLGAQITAARQVGDETAAARLVGQQQAAAEETKLRLVEGATALKDAGIKLREDVDTAFLNLQKLRTGAGGLNQFLRPQDRANQERRTFEQLLPRFREAQAQFRQLRGVDYAPEFTGTTAGINQSILQFIDAVKTERLAVDNTVDTQQALNLNTERLAAVNADLAAKVAELNAKEWVVQVSANVPYDAQSQLEINRASSLP